MMPVSALIQQRTQVIGQQQQQQVTNKCKENSAKTTSNQSAVQRLRLAAASGSVEEVQDLCRTSVPIEADLEGRTALHYAAANGHVAVVRELISSGAEVNAKDSLGYTPLLHAATDGHVEVVKLLLKNNADPNAQDQVHFNSSLHEASWKGYSQTIEALCRHKANPHLKNKQGHSPLHLACQQGHNQSCRIMLLSGSKPDIKNNFGDSPLHSAARYGHAGVVRILISAFAPVNDVNKNGDTALHISSAMGRKKLTRILLEAGCNPTIRNKQGETAMDIALRKNYVEVQEIIANPPPLKKPGEQSKSTKREKENSQGSKDSHDRTRNDRHKKSKSGSTRSVHFPEKSKKIPCYWSPYGCNMHPEANDVTDFPKPKLDSLPSDPLSKGEQYFLDLAGNIRKGPVGITYKCVCSPILNKVEKKMEKDKKELIDHIDSAHDSLNEKIVSLEKKTQNQLVTLNETVKERLAHEREECSERVQRCALRERIEFERRQRLQVEQIKGEVKSWISNKLETHRRTNSCQDHLHQQHRHHHQPVLHHHQDHIKWNHLNDHQNLQQVCAAVSQEQRPRSSQGAPLVLCGWRKPSMVRSKSEIFLGVSAENSDEEPRAVQLPTPAMHQNANQSSAVVVPTTRSGPNKEIQSQDNNQQSMHLQCEKSAVRPKDVLKISTKPKNEASDVVVSDLSGSSLEMHHPRPDENICGVNVKPMDRELNAMPDSNRIGNNADNHTDLMKSLRCNGSALLITSRGENGESPFNDSGYLTKFSPSPREPITSQSSAHSYASANCCGPPSCNNQQQFSTVGFDPPIGLPPPDHSHLLRRLPVPIIGHPRHYNGPNSSLV